MSMTSMLTAVTTLIVRNLLTIPGILIIVCWSLLCFYHIGKIRKERDWYRLVYILLLTVCALICVISGDVIKHFIIEVFVRIRAVLQSK